MNDTQKQFILEQWLPALRSGEFPQTANALHNDRGYCCLGVACALVPDLPVAVDENTTEKRRRYGKCGTTGVLPREMTDILGINAEGWFTPEYRDVDSLVGLNDAKHLSFPEIADFIENELLNPESPYSFTQ